MAVVETGLAGIGPHISSSYSISIFAHINGNISTQVFTPVGILNFGKRTLISDALVGGYPHGSGDICGF